MYCEGEKGGGEKERKKEKKKKKRREELSVCIGQSALNPTYLLVWTS
jgi:hypothetical protein